MVTIQENCMEQRTTPSRVTEDHHAHVGPGLKECDKGATRESGETEWTGQRRTTDRITMVFI